MEARRVVNVTSPPFRQRQRLYQIKLVNKLDYSSPRNPSGVRPPSRTAAFPPDGAARIRAPMLEK